MRIRIHDDKKNKDVFVGLYDPETCTFVKRVKPTHYMIKEKGYGIQEQVVDILADLGCTTVKINTKNNAYQFAFSTLEKKEPRNYGHGLQRFMPVDEMEML